MLEQFSQYIYMLHIFGVLEHEFNQGHRSLKQQAFSHLFALRVAYTYDVRCKNAGL